MSKIKSPQNRTLTLTESDYKLYRSKIEVQDELGQELRNKIIKGDVLEILTKFNDNKFNLIIIDPPYNLSKNFGDVNFEQKSYEDYWEYMNSWLNECVNKLAPNGTMYICSDWKTSPIIYNVLRSYEHDDRCYIMNRITWARDKGRGSEKNWKNNIEDIYMVVKDKNDYVFNADKVKIQKRVLAPYKDKNGNNKDWEDTEEGAMRMTYCSNIWNDITIPFWSMPENTPHPTQKSEKLYARLILASSNEDDLIFEPFAGVCTAGVVAQKLNRRSISIEIDEKWCMYGLKRLDLAKLNPKIQGYEEGIFRDKK